MESRDGLGGMGALELPQFPAMSGDTFSSSGCSEPRRPDPGASPAHGVSRGGYVTRGCARTDGHVGAEEGAADALCDDAHSFIGVIASFPTGAGAFWSFPAPGQSYITAGSRGVHPEPEGD